MNFIRKIFAFFLDKSIIPFLIIGGLNTIISQAGMQLLLKPLGYWGSSAIMFFLCSIASFIFNRKYSFKSNAPLVQSIVRFSVVIAVCYLVSFAVSDLAVPYLCSALLPALPEIWVTRCALLVAQVIFTGFNYVGQRLWAFKE